MENIDDLMRQKFDSDDPAERFEFREEYWEQAQALLEREEGRRRKRWWLIVALVLAFMLLTWCLLGTWFSGSLSQNEGLENSGYAGAKTEKQSDSGVAQLSGKADSEQSTIENTALEGEESKSNTPKTQPSGQQSGLKFDAQEKGFGNSTKAIAAGKSQVTRKGKNDRDKTSNTSERPQANPHDMIPKGPFQSQSGEISDGNPTEKSAKDENPPITNLQSTLPTRPPVGEADRQSIPNSPISQYPNIPTFNLPSPIKPLTIPAREVVPRKVLAVAKMPIAERTNPVESKRLSLGLSLAGSANQSDTKGRWAGWAIGAYGDYRLNKNWSLTLGAQWRFVPGYAAPADSGSPVVVEQLRYSFGFKREVWKRETRGLHYLEIPLSASWEKSRWGLEGGASAGMLIAVENRTEHTTESSLEAAKTEVKKYVKGDKEPYNRQYFSAFAGAEYRLTNRISLITRTQYRFTPIYKNTSEGLKNNGLWNMDLGLRVRLF